jgi:hypothetical protein
MCKTKSLIRLLSVPVLIVGTLMAAPSVFAVQDPPGCNANTLNLTLNRSTNQATPGETVTFGVFLSVPTVDGSGTPACNTVDVDVSAQCPDADNNVPPTTTPQVLATGQSYPAGTTDTFIGSIDCVMPDVSETKSVTAYSEANGILQDTDLTAGSPFTRSNTISVTVVPCALTVDKQVSCDGGATWVDADLVLNNEDGTNGCTALDDDQILVRYEASNDSPLCVLTDCQLSESNGAFGAEPAVGILPPDTSSGLLPAANSPACSVAYGDPQNPNEPNTITLSCLTPSGDTITAEDMATFDCLTVDLLVDRNVDCGTGVEDMTLVRDNDDGTNGCTALDGAPVSFGYQSCNNGEAPLYDCTLVDENLLVSNSIVVGDLAPDGCATPVQSAATNSPVACSTALETAEAPDGGKVTLTCCTTDVSDITQCNEGDRVSVYDVSTVDCDTPADLNIVKECIDDDADGTDDTVNVTVSATAGDVGFTNCTPSDTIYLDDSVCPPSGDGTNIPLTGTAIPFDLAPEGSEAFFGNLPALSGDACNTASVTCDGPEGPVTADADPVVCEGGQGCITRTPGFWGNRSNITAQYLNLEVCGVTLDNVEKGSETSATEAICSVGKDHKLQESPQMAQLIRQCTAAALNIAVSTEEGGSCESESNIGMVYNNCCDAESICTGVDEGMSINECIYQLDEFNNSMDTLDSDVFDSLGRAQNRKCRKSRNNGTVVTPASAP